MALSWRLIPRRLSAPNLTAKLLSFRTKKRGSPSPDFTAIAGSKCWNRRIASTSQRLWARAATGESSDESCGGLPKHPEDSAGVRLRVAVRQTGSRSEERRVGKEC